MKRHRITTATLSLLASALLLAPSAADASAPLLSGYGPPGAGAQTILGAALINGSGGGSGGGSAGDGSSGATATASAAGTGTTGARPAGTTGRSASSQRSTTGNREHPRGVSGGKGATVAANPRAAGANPNSSQLEGSSAVDVTESAASWFSGSDLLALLLASGALALVALATVRLGRTEHD